MMTNQIEGFLFHRTLSVEYNLPRHGGLREKKKKKLELEDQYLDTWNIEGDFIPQSNPFFLPFKQRCMEKR